MPSCSNSVSLAAKVITTAWCDNHSSRRPSSPSNSDEWARKSSMLSGEANCSGVQGVSTSSIGPGSLCGSAALAPAVSSKRLRSYSRRRASDSVTRRNKISPLRASSASSPSIR